MERNLSVRDGDLFIYLYLVYIYNCKSVYLIDCHVLPPSQVITIERNELLHLVAFHKDKDIEREKEREICANITKSISTPAASQEDRAYEKTRECTSESLHAKDKHNKNKRGSKEAGKGEKNERTRTLDGASSRSERKISNEVYRHCY